LIQEPHLFIPNAFTPGGKNPVLRPQYIYIDINKYFFAVFNRWGQKVFETSDPQAGWDGTYNGSIAPEGNYVYSVRIYGTNGREIEKNGTVTLLR
jgi:gliding motility-associated-like protein